MDVIARTTYTPEEKAVLFFRRVKKDLGIQSTQKLVRLVSRVFYHLRTGLNAQQTSMLLGKLPRMFQMLLLNDWKNNTTPSPSYTHLDELADRIYQEDRSSNQSLFPSEVEALNAVIVILVKLDKYLNLFSYRIIQYPLLAEIKQIPVEDAGT